MPGQSPAGLALVGKAAVLTVFGLRLPSAFSRGPGRRNDAPLTSARRFTAGPAAAPGPIPYGRAA
ncbi:hypothetical protein Slala02_58470 [Streptomyces lavendulae subsp. lavendulae]|nr:hypothetical protein Slala01_61880 [Streptomyces lavendulae subsp. lavendulae]GLX30027.1 hypothetical protein Slala02_58470 [Streptomyces lavendulae subsp. lavendulae]